MGGGPYYVLTFPQRRWHLAQNAQILLFYIYYLLTVPNSMGPGQSCTDCHQCVPGFHVNDILCSHGIRVNCWMKMTPSALCHREPFSIVFVIDPVHPFKITSILLASFNVAHLLVRLPFPSLPGPTKHIQTHIFVCVRDFRFLWKKALGKRAGDLNRDHFWQALGMGLYGVLVSNSFEPCTGNSLPTVL